MIRQTSHHATLDTTEVSTGIFRGRTIPGNGRVYLVFGQAEDVLVVSTTFSEVGNIRATKRAEGWILDRALVATKSHGNMSIMHLVDRRPTYKFPVVSNFDSVNKGMIY